MKRPLVAKIGGSLFDLPDLRDQLQTWLALEAKRNVLLIAGGGPAVDEVRRLDGIHQLGEEDCHWLAIRAMSVQAHFLANLLRIPILQTPHLHEGEDNQVAILDPLPFCLTDDRLEHSWRATSDSIAARIAAIHGADLVLMKSVDRPPGITWSEAAQLRLVDELFPEIVAEFELHVTWVNLRTSR